MYNKRTLNKDTKASKEPKSVSTPRDIIYDPMGQWNNPYQPTRVPSSNITMQGVPYPVLGIGSTGQQQIMYPGGEYMFPGSEYVDEFPKTIMQDGGFIDIELTDKEIDEYRRGGYIVEEYNDGGTMGDPPPNRTLPTRYTADPNDPGIQAYADSLNSWNRGVELLLSDPNISNAQEWITDGIFHPNIPLGPGSPSLEQYSSFLLPNSNSITFREPVQPVEYKEYKPNLDTDLAAWLKTQKAPATYAERKKLYEQATGLADYKGTSEQNIGLLNLLKEKGLDYKKEERSDTDGDINIPGENTPFPNQPTGPGLKRTITRMPAPPATEEQEPRPTGLTKQVPKTQWKQLPDGTWYKDTKAGNKAEVVTETLYQQGGTIPKFQTGNGKRLTPQELIAAQREQQNKSNLFNFDPIPKYVGYQGNVPVSESTSRANNNYVPTQKEIQEATDYSSYLGQTAKNIQKKTGKSFAEAKKDAEQLIQFQSQPRAKIRQADPEGRDKNLVYLDNAGDAKTLGDYANVAWGAITNPIDAATAFMSPGGFGNNFYVNQNPVEKMMGKGYVDYDRVQNNAMMNATSSLGYMLPFIGAVAQGKDLYQAGVAFYENPSWHEALNIGLAASPGPFIKRVHNTIPVGLNQVRPVVKNTIKELDKLAGKAYGRYAKRNLKMPEINYDDISKNVNQLISKGDLGIIKPNIRNKYEIKLQPSSTVKDDLTVGVINKATNEYIPTGYLSLPFSHVSKQDQTLSEIIKKYGRDVTNVKKVGKDLFSLPRSGFTDYGLRKAGDFPFSNLYDNVDLLTELKGSGISAEINQALNKTLKQKGLQLYSGATGHTSEGASRYLRELLAGRVSPTNNPNLTYLMNLYNHHKKTGNKRAELMVLRQIDPEVYNSNFKFYKQGGTIPKFQTGDEKKPLPNLFNFTPTPEYVGISDNRVPSDRLGTKPNVNIPIQRPVSNNKQNTQEVNPSIALLQDEINSLEQMIKVGKEKGKQNTDSYQENEKSLKAKKAKLNLSTAKVVEMNQQPIIGYPGAGVGSLIADAYSAITGDKDVDRRAWDENVAGLMLPGMGATRQAFNQATKQAGKDLFSGNMIPGVAGSSAGNLAAAYGAAYAPFHGAKGVEDIAAGNYMDGAANIVGAGLDLMIPGTGKLMTQGAKQASKILTTQTPLKNAYKLNPQALKENPEMFLYRARPVGQNTDMNMAAQLRAKEAAGEPLTWYQRNLLNPQTNPEILAREKYYGQWFEKDPSRLDFYINPGTRNFADNDAIEILRTKLLKSEADKLNISQFDDAKVLSASPETEFILPKQIIESAERFPDKSWQQLIQEDKAFNTPNWLRGYGSNPPKQLPGSGNVDLRLWNIFNKKKTESFLPPSLNAEAELARANADALAFSQSPYNRAKLQEFRPRQDFNVTNTEALFHNDPVAREKFAQLMKDEPDFLNYKNTENWQGAAEGNYGARNFGDIDDLAIVNKNKPQSKIYNAAIHETGHSRSVRLPATKEERAILDDAWKGLKEADGSSLSVLEGEAVQGELRMLLGDKLGKRVYTQKNAGEIKTALEKMIADNHPYMQNINDFNISKIIKSLNKIGLAGVVPAAIATGAAASSNEYKQGGIVLDLSDDQIRKYQEAGYVIEELPKAQKGLFNFSEPDEYVGYQGNVPVSESTRVANTYRPTQQEIKATKEYTQKVGATAQAIRELTGVSHEEAMRQANRVPQVQAEAKAYANTKQAQERDAYVFDEGMNTRDYFRYPLQFLSGNVPTQEERIQDRIRITDPRTSGLDKFMGTVGEAGSLAPEALLNTGIGLAFAPANLSKLGMVADAVSPVGAPNNLFKGVRAQNDILLEQARRSGEAPLPSYMEPYISRRYTPASKEQSTFESFLSPEKQAELRQSRTQTFTPEEAIAMENASRSSFFPFTNKDLVNSFEKLKTLGKTKSIDPEIMNAYNYALKLQKEGKLTGIPKSSKNFDKWLKSQYNQKPIYRVVDVNKDVVNNDIIKKDMLARGLDPTNEYHIADYMGTTVAPAEVINRGRRSGGHDELLKRSNKDILYYAEDPSWIGPRYGGSNPYYIKAFADELPIGYKNQVLGLRPTSRMQKNYTRNYPNFDINQVPSGVLFEDKMLRVGPNTITPIIGDKGAKVRNAAHIVKGSDFERLPNKFFNQGGIVLDLSEDEIRKYLEGGYVVEEL